MDQNQKRKPRKEVKIGKIYATKIKLYLDPETMEPMPEYVLVTEKKQIPAPDSNVVVFHYVSDLEKHPLAKTEKSFLKDFKETWDESGVR